MFFILLLHSYARKNAELVSNIKIFLLFYFYILKFQIIGIDLCGVLKTTASTKHPPAASGRAPVANVDF
jgi:hypothetical protein